MESKQNKIENISIALEKNKLKIAVELCLKLENITNQKHLDLQAISGRISEVSLHFNKGIIEDNDYWQKRRELTKELSVIINDIKLDSNFSAINNTRTIGLPNKNFVGRDDIIDDLFESFQSGERIQVLHGMSGIGKTRIALEYAYKSEKEGLYPELIWWVRSKNLIILENDFCQIATQLNLDKEIVEPDRLIEIIIRWLEKHKNWLLIFDNALDLNAIKKMIPLKGGNVIITTTNPNWNEGSLGEVTYTEIKRLDDKSAAQLVINRSGQVLKTRSLENKIDVFEGLPVLLELFGAYFEDGIRNLGYRSFEELINECFKKERIEEKIDAMINSAISILEPHKLSGISKKFGFGSALILLSWMDSQKIPKYLFKKHLDLSNLGPQNTSGTFGKIKEIVADFFNRHIEMAENIQTLCLKGFLQKSIITNVDEDFISIHPLVQKRLLKKINSSAKFAQKLSVNGLCGLFRKEFNFIPKQIESHEKSRILLPHILVFLDNLKHYGLESKSCIPVVKEVAYYFTKQEQFEQANQYAEYAYNLEKRFKGKVSYETLEKNLTSSMITGDLNRISSLLPEFRNSNKYKLSEELYFKGLSCLLTEPEKSYEFLVAAIKCIEKADNQESNFYYYYLSGGMATYPFDKEEGALYFTKAEKLIIEKFGKESEEYAMCFYNRGAALFNSIKGTTESKENDNDLIEEAFSFYDKAYDLYTSIKGESYFMAVMGTIEQGICAGNWGHNEKLNACYQKVKVQETEFEKKMGKNHIIMGDKYLLYAYVEGAKDDYSAAIPYLKEAKRIYVKNFGKNSNNQKIVLVDGLLERVKELLD